MGRQRVYQTTNRQFHHKRNRAPSDSMTATSTPKLYGRIINTLAMAAQTLVKSGDIRGVPSALAEVRPDLPTTSVELAKLSAIWTSLCFLTLNPSGHGLGPHSGAWLAAMWPAMNNSHEYQVRFLDREGTLMNDVHLMAESLVVATDQARAIAMEIGAANFFITAKADSNIHG
jgi:hypothetical protein